MTDFRFLERVQMKPGRARAIVDITVSVETEAWGADCTVAQAVAQATEGAVATLKRVLSNQSRIQVSAAKLVRVVCDAERK